MQNIITIIGIPEAVLAFIFFAAFASMVGWILFRPKNSGIEKKGKEDTIEF